MTPWLLELICFAWSNICLAVFCRAKALEHKSEYWLALACGAKAPEHRCGKAWGATAPELTFSSSYQCHGSELKGGLTIIETAPEDVARTRFSKSRSLNLALSSESAVEVRTSWPQILLRPIAVVWRPCRPTPPVRHPKVLQNQACAWLVCLQHLYLRHTKTQLRAQL